MSNKVTINFDNLPEVMKRAQAVLSKGMAAATLETQAGITKAISRPQPTTRTASGNKVGLNPSRPGEYPKMVTTDLRRSIHFKIIKEMGVPKGIVYTTSKYAPALEMGGRSFMRRWPKNHFPMIAWAFRKGMMS